MDSSCFGLFSTLRVVWLCFLPYGAVWPNFGMRECCLVFYTLAEFWNRFLVGKIKDFGLLSFVEVVAASVNLMLGF